VSRALTTALLREQAADPWRCWIRHAPARWPGPERHWIDLAAGTLGSSDGEPGLLTALLAPRLDDVLHLPPVEAALAAARDRLAATHALRGTPVLVQLLPGDPLPVLPAPAAAGVVVVVDLLPLALRPAAGSGVEGVAAAVEAMARVAGELRQRPAAAAALGERHPAPGAVAALWPLLPGSDDAATLDALAIALAGAGVAVLQPVPLALSGRDRRALSESLDESTSDASYLRLFHGEPPSPLPPARTAARHGLLPLLPRPLPRPPLRGAANLRVAGALAYCGELGHLLGEPESRAQALLRAARFAEREGRDLAALARDGHLAVLPWLEGEALQVAAEAGAGAEPVLWRQLLSRLQTA
jgi:hypothetical protein